MRVVLKWPSQGRRTRVMVCVALVLVVASYTLSRELHRWAVRRVDAAKAQLARAEWLDAIRCLDKARWADRYLFDAHSLRAYAFTGRR
jgi:hypothetical protein